MKSLETDMAWIVQKGAGKNAETYLSSPLSFIGQRGLDRFIGNFQNGKTYFLKKNYRKYISTLLNTQEAFSQSCLMKSVGEDRELLIIIGHPGINLRRHL
ncbi:hypothetical protein IMSAGC011_03494 [Lachnospiraceae bacterium]|nr:hypothetical protein IMSAGC011_03494 [Lachnospiraceae bacterium]